MSLVLVQFESVANVTIRLGEWVVSVCRVVALFREVQPSEVLCVVFREGEEGRGLESKDR